MNRSVSVALVVAALAAAGIGAAVKAAEDHTTTFTFNYKNVTAKWDPSEDDAALTGTTNVPNVGPVDLKGTLGFHGEPNTFVGSGTLTVRKNKGADKLFFTFTDGRVESSGEFECKMTITGGTGNFENAAGTGLVEGTFSNENEKKETFTVSFLAQGVISF